MIFLCICVVCSVVIPFVRSFYLSLLNCQDKAEAVDEGLIFNVFFCRVSFIIKVYGAVVMNIVKESFFFRKKNK